MVEKSLFLGVAWDPSKMSRGGSTRAGSTDTPMARWADEGKDWIQLRVHSHLRREDVFRHLFESMKQPVDKKKES